MSNNIYLGLIKLTRLMLGDSKNVIISSGNTTVYTNTTPITGATVTYSNATYDGTTKVATNIVVTLNGVTLIKDVDYIVINNGGINAGDYTLTIEGIGEYDNYVVKTFTINKANPVYTAPTKKSLVYNGSPQEMLNAGSTSHGKIQYKSYGSWTTVIPSYTNANMYEISWRLVGDSNHNNIQATAIWNSISAKSVTATITLSSSSYTYNGNARTPSVTAKDGTTTISSSEYTVSYSNNINVGTATVTITDNTGGNYTVSGSKTFTISKVTPTVTAPTAKTLTYSGSAQTLANAGSTNFGTLQYSSDNSTWSTTIPTGTSAGSYTVYYRVVGNSNVNDVSSKSILCSISKIQRTISFTSAPSSINVGSTSTLSAMLSAGSGDGTITYSSSNSSIASISGSTLNGVGEGTCTITATISSGTNYNSASTSYTLTVIDNNFIIENNVLISYQGTNTDITIPNGVTSIGNSAFKNSNITSVTIKSNVKTIDDYAFYGCNNLSNVKLTGGTQSIGNYAFANCTAITWLYIPYTVKTIGNYAFYGCNNLTNITIDLSVTNIGDKAFYYHKLTRIKCGAWTAPTIGNLTFFSDTSNGILSVPSGSNGYDTWINALNAGASGWVISYYTSTDD